jgi:hypothetical protein
VVGAQLGARGALDLVGPAQAATWCVVSVDQEGTGRRREQTAVIVLQGDHGLHGNSEAEITDTFGKDAVAPIWNQVMSALRVPEKYQNGDETYALENPLNMSRYLVNAFVGRNYRYIE